MTARSTISCDAGGFQLWSATPSGGRTSAPGSTTTTIRLLATFGANMAAGSIFIAANSPNSGLIVPSHALLISSRDLIVGLATGHHMPGVYGDRSFAESGGLLSYGNNTADLFRSGATYVDRILKGEKPQDLPVQLPTNTR